MNEGTPQFLADFPPLAEYTHRATLLPLSPQGVMFCVSAHFTWSRLDFLHHKEIEGGQISALLLQAWMIIITIWS